MNSQSEELQDTSIVKYGGEKARKQDQRANNYLKASAASARRLIHPSSPYTYSPLNENAQEIRLLTIIPGVFESEIQVSLRTVSFTANSNLEFEALSYAWGSLENPIDIFVGETGQFTLSVTQNLAEALSYLRYKDKPRIMWIDAICVNQQDKIERSRQVKKMADIYSTASLVIVWLGVESNNSSLAMEWCKVISSKMKVNWFVQNESTFSGETDVGLWQPLSGAKLIAVCNLLARNWFKRLWIWQEVTLAKAVIALCGLESLPWENLRDTVFYLYRTGLTLEGHITTNHLHMCYKLCRMIQNKNFAGLIDDTKHCLCSDPRDRIFSLLSFLSKDERSLSSILEPDYTKKTSEVYREFTQIYIKHKSHLQILATTEMNGQCPSWVPDWSKPRSANPLSSFTKAAGYSAALFSFEDQVLRITGTIIGTINAAESFEFRSNLGFGDMLSLKIDLLRAIENFTLQGFTDPEGKNFNNLCRILCANNVQESYSPPSSLYPRLADVGEFLQELLSSKKNRWNTPVVKYQDRNVINSLVSCCQSRSLFKCSNDTFGLAPKEARKGDVVVVWFGCNSAMVLRPISEGNYKVVGEAYCDGFMHGEAFLGSLPEDFAPISRYAERQALFYYSFAHRESGAFQAEDPRLSHVPLPHGWRSKSHENEEIWTWFVNDETGKKTDRDPRITPAFVRSRGIKVEEFNLI